MTVRYHCCSLQSKYKNLLVSGCSFTHNEHDTHVTWGNTLAYWTGMSINNYAINGAGSSHIANSVILNLEKNKPKTDETLVMVMWSSLGRHDFIIDGTKTVPASHTYHYDTFNQLGELQLLKDIEKPFIQYQNIHSHVLKYWLDVTALTKYLLYHGYKFFYTSIFDLTDFRWGDYENKLHEIDLTFDRTHWLPLRSVDYLGTWAKSQNLVAKDKWHPTPECQELWTQEILIPALQNLEIIDYDRLQV